MESYSFTTNINCAGCIQKVTPFLEREKSIEKWEVDISSPSKILKVSTSESNPEKIVQAVQQAGFSITPM